MSFINSLSLYEIKEKSKAIKNGQNRPRSSFYILGCNESKVKYIKKKKKSLLISAAIGLLYQKLVYGIKNWILLFMVCVRLRLRNHTLAKACLIAK